ncbi:MAG TPA: helix-turn-helix domain-containing protein [Candidatus Paceibacterota bacterium]
MNNMSGKQEYYRAEDLAAKLDVNIMTIYRYIKVGKLRAYKLGKEFRIEKVEFENFLKNASTR